MNSAHDEQEPWEGEARHRDRHPERYTEPAADWPPNPRTVVLFCIAVMAFVVPWACWAVSA